MIVATAGSALARPAAAFLRTDSTRLLSPGDALAGNASQSTSGCRVARGGGARRPHISFAAGGGAVGDAFVVEGTTNVKFSRELMVPGSTEPLIILGTAPVVKSLSITLVRDVDGKTFVKALDDIIARRIKKPTVEEESSLSTFRNIFLERNLKQGTSIYLTWLEPSVMLISISTNQSACQVDAEIKSSSVNYALYDGFFGSSPVSPTLRSSTVQLLEAIFAK